MRPNAIQPGSSSLAWIGRKANRPTQPKIVSGASSHSSGVRKGRLRYGWRSRSSITAAATTQKAYSVPELQ